MNPSQERPQGRDSWPVGEMRPRGIKPLVEGFDLVERTLESTYSVELLIRPAIVCSVAMESVPCMEGITGLAFTRDHVTTPGLLGCPCGRCGNPINFNQVTEPRETS